MSRALIAVVLGLLICVSSIRAQKKEVPEERPKDKGPATERIDAKTSRSLTGTVEKIEAKDENNGTLKMRSSGPREGKLYHYTFQVDSKTKLLTAKGEQLKD